MEKRKTELYYEVRHVLADKPIAIAQVAEPEEAEKIGADCFEFVHARKFFSLSSSSPPERIEVVLVSRVTKEEVVRTWSVDK